MTKHSGPLLYIQQPNEPKIELQNQPFIYKKHFTDKVNSPEQNKKEMKRSEVQYQLNLHKIEANEEENKDKE
ncbi:hypothetical protein [Halalkalibacter urbisdiaboli]|uniref:hypothetical protein n=1 Tax=Halalkalibacter urbisdiaboli TaxID=1960589 RepID=UPI000B437D2F|nr:hypothetical protein [Halalkalibacter urbisdiaboli]